MKRQIGRRSLLSMPPSEEETKPKAPEFCYVNRNINNQSASTTDLCIACQKPAGKDAIPLKKVPSTYDPTFKQLFYCQKCKLF